MPPKNEEENALENEAVNDFVNGEENDVENEGNRISDEINAGENENAFSENEDEMDVENAEEMDEELEGDFPIEEDEDLEEEEEDEFDFPDEDEDYNALDDDVLDDAIGGEEEDKTIDEVFSDVTGDSVKNLELLEELGELAIEKLDDSKAMLCSAISGESPARYASDKKLNKALLKAFVNYLRSNNVKTPSPLNALLLVLLMWGLPTLGAAFFHRSKAKKAAKKRAAKKAERTESIIEDLEIEGEAQSDSIQEIDYTNLKEYQEGRRLFTVHKETGLYNRTPKGQFCKTSLANEKPSPVIQRMLDEGLASAEIREIIYNE